MGMSLMCPRGGAQERNADLDIFLTRRVPLSTLVYRHGFPLNQAEKSTFRFKKAHVIANESDPLSQLEITDSQAARSRVLSRRNAYCLSTYWDFVLGIPFEWHRNCLVGLC